MRAFFIRVGAPAFIIFGMLIAVCALVAAVGMITAPGGGDLGRAACVGGGLLLAIGGVLAGAGLSLTACKIYWLAIIDLRIQRSLTAVSEQAERPRRRRADQPALAAHRYGWERSAAGPAPARQVVR